MAGSRRLAEAFIRVTAKADKTQIRREVDGAVKGANLPGIGRRQGELFSRELIDGMNKRLRRNDIKAFGSHWQTMITAALAFGPAVIPAVAVVGTALAGMTAAAAAAASAFAVFGAVAGTAFKEVVTQQKKVDDLRKKIVLLNEQIRIAPSGSALEKSLVKSQARAVNELQARLNLMPAPLRAAVSGLTNLKSAWESFVNSNKPVVYQSFARLFNIFTMAMPKLQPLFNVGAKAVDRFLASLSAFVSTGGLDRLVRYMSARAGPAIKSFMAIFLNLASAFQGASRAFGGSGEGVLEWLEVMTARLAAFSQGLDSSEGFAKFIDFVAQNGPLVVQAFKDIAQSLLEIAKATAPLAPIVFAVVRALTEIIHALPQPVLTALIGAWIAFGLSLRVAGQIAPVVSGAMRFLNFTTAAVGKAALGTRIQLALLAVQQKAVAAGQALIAAARGAQSFIALAAAATRARIASLALAVVIRTQVAVTYIQMAAAALRARIAIVASAVAARAATIASALLTVGLRALGAAWLFATGPIGIAIGIIALIAAGLVLAYKRSETFRNIVNGVWEAVKTVISVAWNNVIKPVFAFYVRAYTEAGGAAAALAQAVVSSWEGIKAGFRAGIAAVVDFFLGFVGTLITGAAKAFGWVPGIGDKLKAAAEKFNKFREDVNRAILGIKDHSVTVTAKASVLMGQGLSRQDAISTSLHRWMGGPIQGPGTGKSDSILARVSNGEHVWTADEVTKAGGHSRVEHMRKLASSGKLPAFAEGGPVRFNIDVKPEGVQAFQEGMQRFNTGVDQFVVNGATRALKSALAGGGPLGAGSVGGWQNQMRVLRSAFPGLQLISGYRPGAITATGNRSYHASGRAVDIPPEMAVFNWIRANYGAKSKELIFSPANGNQIWNGRPHMFSGVTRNDHWDHIHWAMDKGGYLFPGMNPPIWNGTGGKERVLDRRETIAYEAGQRKSGGGGTKHEHHWHVNGIAPFTARDAVEAFERLAIMNGL